MAPCVEVELNLSMWVHYRNLAFPQYKYYGLLFYIGTFQNDGHDFERHPSFLRHVVPGAILLEVKLFLPFKSKGCCITSY